MKSVKDTACLIAFLLLLTFMVSKAIGCVPREAKEAAAEGTYLGQQIDCVDKWKPNQPAIDECRDAVKARWGVKDAGGDR